LVSISDLGKYIGSGSQGSVWQHASEPDKIIKVMKGFPLLKDGEMDAFQYDRYLERRMGATQWARDHDKWMFPPMANKMVLYLFRETMAMRKDNVSLPTGQVKVYAVDNQIFELKDMRRLYKTIVNNGQFGEASEEAQQFKRDWLTILSPGHRHGYLMVQEKLDRIGGRSRAQGQERPQVFEEWSTFLWSDFGLVTRDTKNPGNYGFRNNKDLVIYDPVVAPLPEQNDWSSRNVFNRLRYAYFVYLFTDIPKINDIDEHDAHEVNKIIRRFEKQIIAGNFYRIERQAEGFPGSYQPEPSLNDYGLRDIMYSGTASDNFQQTLANFGSEVDFEEEIKWDEKKPAPDWQDDIEWESETFNATPKQPKVKFPRAKADKIVATVEAQIKPYVEKMMACGSYRRGAQMIGDIDFVVILKDGYTLPQILPSNQGINWVGEQKAQIIIDGEKVDFRVTTPEAWGATILYFTGPADFNIKYRWMAKRRGLKLSEYGLFNRESDEYLAGATEEDVFTALGRPYREPDKRQGFSKSKKKTTKKAEEVEVLLHPNHGWDRQIDILEEFPNAKNFDALLNQQLYETPIRANSLDEMLELWQKARHTFTGGIYYINFPLTVYRGAYTKGVAKQWTWKRWLEDDKMGTSQNMGILDTQPATLNIQEALQYAGARSHEDGSGFELYSIEIQDYFVMFPRPSQPWHHGNCNPVYRDDAQGIDRHPRNFVSCDNPQHVDTPVIFILGGARYEDLNVIWDSDANHASFDAEDQHPICPICDGYIPNDERPGAYPGAISRYDNETEVCSACGTTEGVGMMILGNEINVLAEEAKEFTDDPWEIWRYIIANAKEQLPPIFLGRAP